MIKEKVILCFGDSLTWGEEPGTGRRYPSDVRWTGVLQKELGPDFRIAEDGLGGRCTVFDDPWYTCRNGRDALGYSLNTQKPLSMVILMLGTNDLKVTDPYGAARGIQTLVRMIRSANALYPAMSPVFRDEPKRLIVSPPRFHPDIDKRTCAAGGNAVRSALAGKWSQSAMLAELYESVAKMEDVYFLDAGLYCSGALPDCVHIDARGHESLGTAIAQKVLSIYSE